MGRAITFKGILNHHNISGFRIGQISLMGNIKRDLKQAVKIIDNVGLNVEEILLR